MSEIYILFPQEYEIQVAIEYVAHYPNVLCQGTSSRYYLPRSMESLVLSTATYESIPLNPLRLPIIPPIAT